MTWGGFAASLRNAVDAFFRGELLMRIGADKYFPHILYLVALVWLSIMIDIFVEKQLGKVEKNREVLTTLRIYHSQKVVEMVSLDRVTTVERLLREKGSDVTLPEKPAYTIAAKDK